MDPFKERPLPAEKQLGTLTELYPRPYDKHTVDPYTRARIILAVGTEIEASRFSHSLSRSVADNELRRELALTRAVENRQQVSISLLKPGDESPLEHTIGYEQLAVDLTAELARGEKDCYVKKALDFALLEDFDHLYRYANLLDMEQSVRAERLVGGYTELMPGRPTVAHHRFPTDNVRRSIDSRAADKRTVLATMTITAAEQQTMNYYMNVTSLMRGPARALYEEIALVEEEHVTQYEDLMDPTASPLAKLLWHEYNECYLYWSCYATETDARIRAVWERCLYAEIGHLHAAARLLEKYEGKSAEEVIADGEFPAPLSLHENIAYVRDVLAKTAQFTSVGEEYERVENLPPDARFFAFQSEFLPRPESAPSHAVIDAHICQKGADYRFGVAPSPLERLRCRTADDVTVGRVPYAAESTDFTCNE